MRSKTENHTDTSHDSSRKKRTAASTTLSDEIYENLQNDELNSIQPQPVHADEKKQTGEIRIDDPLAETENFDLSDPTALELLIDDETIPTMEYAGKHAQQIHDAQKALLSIELARQKGVEITDDKVIVPGRVPLSLFSLLETLFCTLGFAAGMFHFAIMSPNFCLAVIVMYILIISQIFIYHTSYRAMRMFLAGFHTFLTLCIMALCGWAFLDQILYPSREMPHVILGVSLFFFTLVPVLMVAHFVYLGRGSRQISLKKKKTPATTPTKVLKTPSNTPTKRIKQG